MSARTLQVLGVVAVASLGLGVYLSGRDKGSEASTSSALVPVLEDRLNDVAAVRIEGGDGPFTLERVGDDWVVEEKAGYPADGAKLRQLLIELRRARRLERKTASPAGFEELGVQDPGTEGATSRSIALLDAQGEEIARVIVGKRRFGKGAATGPVRADEESYVRVAGDPNAWLAAGKLFFDTSALRWLDQVIFDVPRGRVAAAEIARAEGETLTLARATKDEFEMQPVTVPEGREAKTPLGTSQVVNALTGLRFDDVAKADGFEWPESGTVTTTFWTFDGLKVTTESVDKDGKTWSRFRAEVVDKTARPGVPGEELVGPPPLLAADTPADDEVAAEGDAAEGDAAAPAEPAGPTPEELAAEAKKINDKASGWVFALPSWKVNAFRMKLEDVLAPLPSPDAPEADAQDADVAPDAAAPPAGGGEAGQGAGAPAVSEQPPGEPSPAAEPPAAEPPAVAPPAGGGPGEPGAGG